jgi:transcriptional regulator with XRE-family HTH domain
LSLSTLDLETPPDGGFPGLLRAWRRRRRMSQLGLALASDVSQRHVSFLESGRARPSRAMILQLSETLDVPLRERNAWLVAAGFAPVYRLRPLDDPQMEPVIGAVRTMLAAHEPFPGVALDRDWNVVLSNAPFDRTIALLGEDIWTRVGATQPNLMRLFFHPQGIRPLVTNWPTIGPLLWLRARKEAETLGGKGVRALLTELAPYQSDEVLWPPVETALAPVAPFEMRLGDLTISMFAIIATLGTAQDVTAEELRIETLFPADPQTEAFFRAAHADAPR